MSQIETIIWNIVGGILAGLVLLGLERFHKFFRARRFRSFFGCFGSEYYIVYGRYVVPQDVELPVEKPKIKRPRCETKGIGLGPVTSGAQAKSLSYLVGAFRKEAYISPVISAHSEVDEKMEISFISIGGFGNFKTVDLLENAANVFVDFDRSPLRIVRKKDGKTVVDANTVRNFDYGIIVKIHPASDPTQTWICCAGFGVWATSGSAYYLANKWREIKKWAGYGEFGCVVKTVAGSDDSTIVIGRYRTKPHIFREPIVWLNWLIRRIEIMEVEKPKNGSGLLK